MDERAEFLRRRIELYRRYLREGVDIDVAAEYLRQIAEDEGELAEIGVDKHRWTRLVPPAPREPQFCAGHQHGRQPGAVVKSRV